MTHETYAPTRPADRGAGWGRGRPRQGLTIPISAGVGDGATELAAFDAALHAAGVSNFNLIRLSSVIPVGARVQPTRPDGQLRGGWGDRLHCVYAAQTTSRPGSEAWAGVGWVVAADGSGRGLFVEHEGEDERWVRQQIVDSLKDLARTRAEPFSPPQTMVTGVRCVDRPVAAVVIAAYEVSSWGGGRPGL
jgi:arginine decarboxylase